MNGHVLIVEDSATQRTMLAADLEAVGFEVTVARDGQEALDLLHDGADHVDLIVSDIVMPRLDGLELCRRIKSDSALPDLPVVLLTSLQNPLDIVRGLEVGADNFFTKPYDADHLVSRVQAILASRNERPTHGDVTYLQLLGHRFAVTAEREQILELLVGAFSDLVHANQQLRERELQLADSQAELAARLAQVEHERARLAAVLNAIPDGIVIVSADGRITDINPAITKLGIWPADRDAAGTHVRDLPITLFDDAGRKLAHTAWPIVRAYHGQPTTTGVDLLLHTADGHNVPVTITAAPITDTDGKPTDAVEVVRDVSAWAFHDRLTALPNRTLFADRIERALTATADSDTQATVLVVGIDQSTVVHDTLGRAAEDSLAIVVARRLVGAVRKDATVGRLGADRFGILLRHTDDPAHAMRVATRIADTLNRPVTLEQEEVFLTASIGIATQTDDSDAETLLQHAYTALHRAGDTGGARVEIYDERAAEQARRRLFLDAAMRRGLEQHEFVAHFQPVVSLQSNRAVETEALVRWQHPEQGLISPAEFIPLAEENGLIVPLGRSVLEQACHQTQRWRETTDLADLRVAVNLSARQLDDPNLETDITDVLGASGLPADALTLEVTESALINDPKQATRTLEGLRRLGVRIAIDDFGTGYSSLSYLRMFPFDVLKIDRTFIQQIADDHEAAAIAQAIITLARSLHVEVIAEGVETPEQLDWLHGAGCQLVTGFLLCRPLPAAELETRLGIPLVPDPGSAA